MGKHLSKEIKYNYVMKYKNGESPTKLELELINLNLSQKKTARSAMTNILLWNSKFNKEGITGLISKTGLYFGENKGRPKKKKKIDYDQFTKEELVEIARIKDEFIEELTKDKKSKKFQKINNIRNNAILSINKLCLIFDVSKSGYYKWCKTKNHESKFDKTLLNDIEILFHQRNQKYGYRRIKVMLERDLGIHRNTPRLSSVIWQHLGLKSSIRRKKNQENKKMHNSNVKM